MHSKKIKEKISCLQSKEHLKDENLSKVHSKLKGGEIVFSYYCTDSFKGISIYAFIMLSFMRFKEIVYCFIK
jgi:hypothetical protein